MLTARALRRSDLTDGPGPDPGALPCASAGPGRWFGNQGIVQEVADTVVLAVIMTAMLDPASVVTR